MSDDIDLEESSGNVFADLDLPDPEVRVAKAKLARQIAAIIGERSWTQIEAAGALGLQQSDVSNLMRGRLRDVSLDRLLAVLTRSGQADASDVRSTRESKRHDRVDDRNEDRAVGGVNPIGQDALIVPRQQGRTTGGPASAE